MKKVMSLKTKELLQSGIIGIGWTIVGVIQILKLNSIVNLIAVSLLLVASSFMFAPYFLKTEIEDEMSEHNEDRAKSITYTLLNLFIMICMLMSILRGEWIVNLRLTLPFLVGGMNILKFGFFIFYEKVGD